MSVLIDASAIHEHSGGAGRYLRGLVRTLPGAGVDPIVMARRNDFSPWEGALEVRRQAPRRRPNRLLWEQLGLPRSIDDDIDVLHSPHYSMPVRVRKGLRRVVTIHDLSFFTHPGGHSTVKRRYFRRAIAHAALHADALICISQTTADELHRLVPVRAAVHVVAHGVDHSRFRPSAPGDIDETEMLARLGVSTPFILHLGAIEPRKNVGALVAAYDEVMRRTHVGELTLVLAGRPWRNMTVPQPERGRLLRLGFVADEAVPALLRAASVVAYPSVAEGFGLPVLEALACGAPVVTTGGTVMEEVAGNAALYVRDGNAGAADPDAAFVKDLAIQLERALDGYGPTRTTRLSRARPFTWEACAAAHAAVYSGVHLGR